MAEPMGIAVACELREQVNAIGGQQHENREVSGEQKELVVIHLRQKVEQHATKLGVPQPFRGGRQRQKGKDRGNPEDLEDSLSQRKTTDKGQLPSAIWGRQDVNLADEIRGVVENFFQRCLPIFVGPDGVALGFVSRGELAGHDKVQTHHQSVFRASSSPRNASFN